MAKEEDFRELFREFAERNKDVTELKFIHEDGEGFKIEKIPQQGYLNHLLLVTSRDGTQKVILKHGSERAANAELHTLQLSLDRQDMEYKALILFNRLIPGSVPKGFAYDPKLHIVAMEFLNDMNDVGEYFQKGEMTVSMAKQMGEILGKLHYRGHRDVLPPQDWQDITENLRNQEMKDMYEDLAVKRQMEGDKSVCNISDGIEEEYYDCIKDLKAEKLLEKCHSVYRKKICVTHGDTHAMSFMLNEKQVQMIDMEFAGPGSPMFDLSLLLLSYIIISMDAAIAKTGNFKGGSETWTDLEVQVRSLIEAYRGEFGAREDLLGDNWLSDVTLMIGMQFIRAMVFPLASLFPNFRDQDRLVLIKLGKKLMRQHEDIRDLATLLETIFQIGN